MPALVRVAQDGAGDAPAIVHVLVMALDVPGGVVGDDEDSLRSMPDRRIDLHELMP